MPAFIHDQDLRAEARAEVAAELRAELREAVKREVDAQPNISASMRAEIARKVEAKLAARLDAGLLAGASPSTDNGANDKGAPQISKELQALLCLSKKWQVILFILSLPASAFGAVYGWTGQSWYGCMGHIGHTLFFVSVFCGIWLFLASPCYPRLEKALAVYTSLWLFAVLGGPAVGCFITDEEGDPFWGWLCTLLLPLCFAIFYLP
mmetsp:Transcript_22807/g.47498  ORF Transcript_22807/g.47498 Transcript_22807/m.47498 type:complete len:208 (-) Transcript_22807:56-679(-)